MVEFAWWLPLILAKILAEIVGKQQIDFHIINSSLRPSNQMENATSQKQKWNNLDVGEWYYVCIAIRGTALHITKSIQQRVGGLFEDATGSLSCKVLSILVARGIFLDHRQRKRELIPDGVVMGALWGIRRRPEPVLCWLFFNSTGHNVAGIVHQLVNASVLHFPICVHIHMSSSTTVRVSVCLCMLNKGH